MKEQRRNAFCLRLKRAVPTVLTFLMVLLTLPLLSGCDDKLGKLKGKGEEAERELNAIEREHKALQEKIDKLERLERQDRTRTPETINRLVQEIASEQRLLNKKRDTLGKKLDELEKEIRELSETYPTFWIIS